MGEEDNYDGEILGGYGEVYRWLWLHFDYVSKYLEEGRPSWEMIGGKMAKAGVIGRGGKPPNRRSVWKVWQRVCRDMKVEAARLQAKEEEQRDAELYQRTGVRPNKRHPSDMPRDMKPPVVEPSFASMPIEPAPMMASVSAAHPSAESRAVAVRSAEATGVVEKKPVGLINWDDYDLPEGWVQFGKPPPGLSMKEMGLRSIQLSKQQFDFDSGRGPKRKLGRRSS